MEFCGAWRCCTRPNHAATWISASCQRQKAATCVPTSSVQWLDCVERCPRWTLFPLPVDHVNGHTKPGALALLRLLSVTGRHHEPFLCFWRQLNGQIAVFINQLNQIVRPCKLLSRVPRTSMRAHPSVALPNREHENLHRTCANSRSVAQRHTLLQHRLCSSKDVVALDSIGFHLDSGRVDGSVRSGRADGSVSSGRVDGSVRSGWVDGSVRSGWVDGSV